jgi:hypothetical protein
MALDCDPGSYASLERGQSGSYIPDPDINITACHYLQVTDGGMTTVQEPVDKQACLAALAASPNQTLVVEKLTVGSWVCTETGSRRHIAAMRITSVPGPGAPQIAFTYTVWG